MGKVSIFINEQRLELPSCTFNKLLNVLGLAVYQVIWSEIYSFCNCWKNKYSLLCSSWCRPINANISVPAKPSYIRKSPILSGFQLLLFLNCFTLLQHIPSIWKSGVCHELSFLPVNTLYIVVTRLWAHRVEAELTSAQGFLLGPHLRSGATTKYLLMGKHWGCVYLCMV